MPELNLIIPYCFIQGKICAYDSGLVDGYFLGLATMFMIYMLIQCVKTIEEECDDPKYEEVTLDEDEESVEDIEEELEEDQIEEKLEEDKKDD